MSLDDFVDVQTAAIAMLAMGAANADLAATAGEDVVKVAIGAPVDLGHVGQNNLPCLLVYRLSSAAVAESRYVLNAHSNFVLEYFAPVCPADKLALRWPLLRRVWASIAAALQGGMHASVSSGSQVLDAAGLRAELGTSTTADFRRGAANGGGFYPYFKAQMRFYEEVTTDVGVTDIEGLDLFLRLHTTWQLPDNTATTPAITQGITLNGYPATVVMSGDYEDDAVGMSGDEEGTAGDENDESTSAA